MTNTIAYRITQPADGVVAIECANGQVCVSDKYQEIYCFITKGTGYASIPRVVWSLKDTVPILLSLLPDFAKKELADTNRATWEAGGMRYRLYIQRSASDPDDFKFFSANVRGVTESQFEINIYELDQFFERDADPKTAREVQALADELVDCFKSFGVHNITKMNSPVAIAEASGLLDRIYDQLPDPEQIPGEVKALAAECDVFAVWQSCFQVGYWEEAYSYDLSSAYPSEAIRLVDLTGAEYRHSKTMLSDAHYGFLRGEITINPDHPHAWASPIVAGVDEYGNTNPVGTRKGVFTLDQVNFVARRGLGTFVLKDGWFIFPRKGAGRPLDDVMRSLYAKRSADPLTAQVGKRIINGVIGRLGEYRIERDRETGRELGQWALPYTNPVYHTIIRTNTTLRVGAFVFDNDVKQDELIHVNTDGCYLTRRVSGVSQKSNMGAWRSDGVHRLLVLSSQKYRTDDMCDHLLAEIKTDPNGYRYESAGGLNLMTLADDQERVFKSFPKSGRGLLTKKYISEPVRLGT